MEGKSRLPEVTIVPAPRQASSVGAMDAAKAAGKEPTSPGTPSSSSADACRGKERRAEVEGVSLPGWKLEALCQESCPSPAMRMRFPYF